MDKQDEIFVVVDKNDKIIGYHTRFDCHHNKSLTHRAVGVVVFNNKGLLLIQKRSKSKDLFPGFYTISASGHVGKNESYLQAAKRELKEELGISSPLKHEVKFLIELPQETEMDCLFTARHNGPFTIEADDIDEVKFVTPAELKKIQPKLTPYAITNFKQLGLL